MKRPASAVSPRPPARAARRAYLRVPCALLCALTWLVLGGCGKQASKEQGRRPAPAAKVSSTTAALNANPQLSDFAVEASNSVRLQTSSAVNGGDVGARGTGTGPFLSSGFVIDVGTSARVQTSRNLIAESIRLGTSSIVGDVQTNQLTTGAGATRGNLSPLVSLPPVPAPAAVTVGTANLTVAVAATVSAAPGRFATVSVGTSGKLRLAAGLYEIRDLTLSSSARIEALGPVELRVGNRLGAATSSFIGAAPGVTLSARELRIEVSGINGTTGALTATPPAAALGSNSQVRAVMLVPNGSLVVGSSAQLTGAFLARDVDLGTSVTVTFQDGIAPPLVPPVITTQPGSQTVLVGATATFSALVSGNDVTLQWQRNGAPIAGATASSYTTGALTRADSGSTFRLLAQNTAGQVLSDTATLTVVDCLEASFPVEPTSCGVGACARTGQRRCVAGDIVDTCTPGNPAPEICNGVDDDCDAEVDEGSFTPVPTTCGVGICAASGERRCIDGEIRDTCTPGTPGSEICNAIDDDCDGQVDEGSFTPEPTTCGVGRCARSGQRACVGGAIIDTCTPGEPAPETCNGLDDDCNGAVDGLPPRCAGQMLERCTGGGWAPEACDDANVCNGAEQCNDGACVAGAAPSLDDGNPCTADSCSASQGITHTPHAAGTACGPGAACDGSGTCVTMAPPVIVTQPANQAGSPGGQVTFSVVATGEALSYQWLSGGEPISGATGASYTRTGLTAADDGMQLSVRVQNLGGSVVSRTVTLRVASTQTVVSVQGDNPRTVASDFIVLTGTASESSRAALSVTVTSDRYAGQTFGGLVDEDATFSSEVPLALGENLLTVRATGPAGTSAEAQITVHSQPSVLPRVLLTAPVSGSRTTQTSTSVTGVVRSTLPPNEIRLVLGERVTFPSGSGGEYSFQFDFVPLLVGPNLLTVRAETVHGNVLAQTSVIRDDGGTTPVAATPPRISVTGTGAEVYVPGPAVSVNGTVVAARCVSQVTVNGTSARLTGVGATVSFELNTLSFASGADELPITVVARDCDNQTASLSYTARRDTQKPLITVANLSLGPAENPASQTPYPITGTITESNLAGFAANEQSIGVLPTGAGTYSFSFDVQLVHGPARSVLLEAWDFAGNAESVTVNLVLQGNLEIELVSPADGASFMAEGATGSLEVVARIPGIAPTDRVTARIDAGAAQPLTLYGDVARGSLSAGTGDHTLLVSLESAGGEPLGSRSVRFRVLDRAAIPLSLTGSDPANEQTGVEGNASMLLRLSRPVSDPLELSVLVTETVHGMTYRAAGSGAGAMPDVVRVDRDQEPVSGTVTVLPGGDSARFEASREFAFGASIDVAVSYDEQPLGKFRFQVRPLPTLANGAVFAASGEPLSGVEVELVELGRKAETDDGGSFSFGFGEPASRDLPAGSFTLRANGQGKLLRFGAVERKVRLEAGRFNSLSMIRLPNLSESVPSRLVEGGAANVLFDGGRLAFDLSQASVRMPDGAPAGAVHIEPYLFGDLTLKAVPYATPAWVYAAHPVGVAVNGSLGVSIALPALEGSYAYLDGDQTRVLLLGVDEQTLELVPVGVGLIDKVARRLRSEGVTHFRRLDAIGYAPIGSDAQAVLERYGRGEIDLSQLVRTISTVSP